MSVYVDYSLRYSSGTWCHMMADTPEELQAMARKIGLRPEWFQDHPVHPHYDLRPNKRALAVHFGALEVTSLEMLRRVNQGVPR